ncbi:hypothetical protein OPT61_g2669 [Boeremia exigua]|uniref:Uncharacterized protein n=1 Tax=Boeremia exigua TaxID=749465 RepID=A0ACC2IKW3_9PLEO|nr:hypothetical protein OPT61_g2669 [Boeremia exigua]
MTTVFNTIMADTVSTTFNQIMAYTITPRVNRILTYTTIPRIPGPLHKMRDAIRSVELFKANPRLARLLKSIVIVCLALAADRCQMGYNDWAMDTFRIEIFALFGMVYEIACMVFLLLQLSDLELLLLLFVGPGIFGHRNPHLLFDNVVFLLRKDDQCEVIRQRCESGACPLSTDDFYRDPVPILFGFTVPAMHLAFFAYRFGQMLMKMSACIHGTVSARLQDKVSAPSEESNAPGEDSMTMEGSSQQVQMLKQVTRDQEVQIEELNRLLAEKKVHGREELALTVKTELEKIGLSGQLLEAIQRQVSDTAQDVSHLRSALEEHHLEARDHQQGQLHQLANLRSEHREEAQHQEARHLATVKAIDGISSEKTTDPRA